MVYYKFFNFSKFNFFTILCFLTLCDCINVSNSVPEFGNRILNGMRADDYQFPYQVSLQKNYQHHCGGSIISEVKVLTAGHCVANEDGISSPTVLYRILAGTNNLNNTELKNYYSVKKFSIHPKFDQRRVQYDYAVVFIKGQFDFKSPVISMIPLATQDALPGTVCYLSGWGDVDKSRGIKISNELQFAKMTVDPPEVCQILFGNIFSSTHMLCAGQSNKENAGCGDSGGPFACNNKLNGIVSFGRKYYASKFPDVYSNVVYAFHWIDATNDDGTTNGSRKHTVGSFYFVTFTVLSITQNMLSKQT